MTDCTGVNSCPGVHKLPSGDFLVVGNRMDGGAVNARSVATAFGIKVADHENAVILPRKAMLSALYALAHEMAQEMAHE